MIDRNTYYLRNPGLVAVGTKDAYLLISAGGAVITLETTNAAAWSDLMQRLMRPITGAELTNFAARLPAADRDFLNYVIATGYIISDSCSEALTARQDLLLTDNQGYHIAPQPPACGRLVVGLTGSIVAGLMPPVLISLAYSGFQSDLDVLLTPTTQKFITPDLLESYGIRTWTDTFDRKVGVNVAHASLGSTADCVLVMPASAAALHRLANGTCTDLISLVASATTAPLVIAPVMNTTMWNHPPVQRNADRLRQDCAFLVEPTMIFKAADAGKQATPMYGGPGPFWLGAEGVMHLVTAVLAHQAQSETALIAAA